MRESLLELLKKKELSFIDELEKLNILLKENNATYSYFYYAFKNSTFSVNFVDLDKALFYLLKSNVNLPIYELHDFEHNIEEIKSYGGNLNLNGFLCFLDLFKTLSLYKDKTFLTDGVKQIINIVDYDCEKLGYKFLKEGKSFKACLKNPLAESTAVFYKKSTRDKIYDYLMIRSGNVSKKREIIKSLADDVELICKKYNSIYEYEKLQQFIQCTRHSKDKPKKEFPFYYLNEEEWLDKTFEMVIGILSFTRTKEIAKEIKEEENKAS